MTDAGKRKIIDAHGHIFPDKIALKATEAIGRFYGVPMVHVGTAAEMQAGMAKIGVARQLVCSTATTPEQVAPINDFIARCCAEYPAFFGFATLHPDYDDLEGELARIRSLGLRGVKLHTDFQQFHIDHPGAMRMYRLIAAEKLPVLFHMGDETRPYSEPAQLRRLLDAVPSLVAIAAHFGGYRRWEQAETELRDTGCYFDTSSSLAFLSPERAAEMILSLGEDRFFYGTDFPMWDHEEELARFLRLPLNETQREKIFHANFERLFGPV